jgi:hypothetical protein
MSRLLNGIAAALVLLTGELSALHVRAQTDTLPVVKLVTGTPISPATADSYYGGASESTTHTAKLCSLNAIMCGLPRAIPIHELARSLSQGGKLSAAAFTQNVFEYVYRNIDTEFRYGLSKGAFGALLDQSGTPFDQAHLMVELLREGATLSPSYSAISPSYQAGTISLTPSQFQAWTGLTNAQTVCQYLANGAIPAIINGSTPSTCSTLSGNLTSLTIAHIWVAANGLLYDPSFKTYVQKPGIDIAAAMQCGNAAAPTCGALALAAAIPSTSQGFDSGANANYVQNVQYTALGNLFANTAAGSGLAINLQHYIQTNAPTANVQDIVGGETIDPASLPTSGVLPYTIVATQHTWSDIPDQYRSWLNIQFNTMNVSVYADETIGYWLYIAGVNNSASSRTATLFFERERNTAAPTTPGLTVSNGAANEVVPLASATDTSGISHLSSIVLTANHPYAAGGGSYMDDTFTRAMWVDDVYYFSGHTGWSSYVSPFVIVQAWGRMGRGAADRAASMAAGKYPAYGSMGPRYAQGSALPASVSENILTTLTLPQTVATWLGQAGLALSIIDGIGQTRTQEHHTLGVIEEGIYNGQVNAQELDAWTSLSSTSTSGAVSPSFATATAAYNALEGSTVEQQQDTPDGGSAIRWFELTNQKGTKFYQATPANASTVLASTVNYTNIGTGDPKQLIQSYLNNASPTFNMAVAQNGSVGTWSNSTTTLVYMYAPALAYSTDGTQIGYVTTSGAKGGGSGLSAADPSGSALATVQNVKPQKPLEFNVSSADGGLTVSLAPDLVTGAGSFPYSLSYRRYYNISEIVKPICALTVIYAEYFEGCQSPVGTRLLNGWRDNFQIEADFADDGFRGLGADSALDASSTIAALYTIHNLAASPTFNSYIGQAFVAAWLTDQLGANAVVVHRPPATETFVRLPDGRFNPRPGGKDQFTQTGSRVTELWPNGFGYEYGGIQLLDTDETGSALRFKSYFPNNPQLYYSGIQFEPTSWIFPDGITVSFSYSNPGAGEADLMTGVSNNLGRSLTFSTTACSSLPSGYTNNTVLVTDDAGRTACSGDLPSAERVSQFAPVTSAILPTSTAVMRPDGSYYTVAYSLVGSSTLYDYADTRIASISLPNNPSASYLSFAWDGLRRASSSTDANGHSINYFPARVSAEQTAKGAVADALGNVTTTYFDRFSHPLEVIDPLLRASTKAYDDIGRLTLDANPLLGCTNHFYDVRGNETSTAQYPAGSCTLTEEGNGQLVNLVGSPPTPITTSATYGVSPDGPTTYLCANPITCNKTTSQTDALGLVTNYSWDGVTGNLTQVLKPADPSGQHPETDLVYTPLTGSSACSNGATANGVAMLCQKTEKISSSASLLTTYTYNASNKYVLAMATVDPNGLNLRTCFKFDTYGRLISTSDPRLAPTACP